MLAEAEDVVVVPPFACTWLEDEHFRFRNERGCVVFEVLGRNDATLLLKPRPGSRRWQHATRRGEAGGDEGYTLIVGSHRNGAFKIERNGEPTYLAAPRGCALDPQSFKPFWVAYEAGAIAIGEGPIPGAPGPGPQPPIMAELLRDGSLALYGGGSSPPRLGYSGISPPPSSEYGGIASPPDMGYGDAASPPNTDPYGDPAPAILPGPYASPPLPAAPAHTWADQDPIQHVAFVGLSAWDAHVAYRGVRAATGAELEAALAALREGLRHHRHGLAGGDQGEIGEAARGTRPGDRDADAGAGARGGARGVAGAGGGGARAAAPAAHPVPWAAPEAAAGVPHATTRAAGEGVAPGPASHPPPGTRPGGAGALAGDPPPAPAPWHAIARPPPLPRGFPGEGAAAARPAMGPPTLAGLAEEAALATALSSPGSALRALAACELVGDAAQLLRAGAAAAAAARLDEAARAEPGALVALSPESLAALISGDIPVGVRHELRAFRLVEAWARGGLWDEAPGGARGSETPRDASPPARSGETPRGASPPPPGSSPTSHARRAPAAPTSPAPAAALRSPRAKQPRGSSPALRRSDSTGTFTALPRTPTEVDRLLLLIRFPLMRRRDLLAVERSRLARTSALLPALAAEARRAADEGRAGARGPGQVREPALAAAGRAAAAAASEAGPFREVGAPEAAAAPEAGPTPEAGAAAATPREAAPVTIPGNRRRATPRVPPGATALTFVHPNDRRGVFSYLGSDSFRRQWVNPAMAGVVRAWASSPASRGCDPRALVGRSAALRNQATPGREGIAFWAVDLGPGRRLAVARYSLRADRSRNAPVGWAVQGCNRLEAGTTAAAGGAGAPVGPPPPGRGGGGAPLGRAPPPPGAPDARPAPGADALASSSDSDDSSSSTASQSRSSLTRWVTVDERLGDPTLRASPGAVGCWAVRPREAARAFRYFRVVLASPTPGADAPSCLALSGLELWGVLTEEAV